MRMIVNEFRDQIGKRGPMTSFLSFLWSLHLFSERTTQERETNADIS